MTSYTQLRQQVAGIRTGTVPGWLTQALTNAVAAPRDAAVLRHPLGFLCIPVIRFEEGGVCVHVWTRRVHTPRPTTSSVHCHSWDLQSLVLDGEIHNHLVRVTPTTGVPSHRVFEVHSHGDVDEIRATPQLVHCGPGTVESHRAGEVYVMPSGTFHRSEVPGGEATTLMLARNRPGHHDRSIGPIHARSHQVWRKRCDAAECGWVARTVLQLLERTQPAAQPV
ncbi:hypothetical protein FDG2_2725 [Candidatus Protofrankia californiensis]|uniref:Uncharacterized protein n=1 Tax=Candidatus Protofrankia californiensis TaxID=1839754 RepID=A0A1C3NY69_9ACTN|nr:hypothetical protein FDG2_2725 [Candidatus Protofrankia californiensis]